MTGVEASLVAGLSTFLLDTLKDTAREESGGSLAKWLNKDIGKAAQQVIYNATNLPNSARRRLLRCAKERIERNHLHQMIEVIGHEPGPQGKLHHLHPGCGKRQAHPAQ